MSAPDSRQPLAAVRNIGPSDKRESSQPARRAKASDFPDETWAACQADFRVGISYGKLSETYGIPVELIVRRKQEKGWRKDLRAEVQAEVTAALAAGTSAGAGSRDLSDQDIVERAAVQGVDVVRRHRAVLTDTIVAVSTLAAALCAAAEAVSRGGAAANLCFPLGPKETLSEAALKISNALARIVPLERKSYGLEESGDERPYEEQLRAFHAARAARAAKAGG